MTNAFEHADDPVGAQRELLRRRLVGMQRLVRQMMRSHDRLQFPVAPHLLREASDTSDALAAFLQRFGLLVDLLGASMKALLAFEGGTVASFRDVVASMVKLGVLGDEDDWRTLRLLRNRLAHEYETESDRFAQEVDALHRSLPLLLDVHRRFEARCLDSLSMDARDLSEEGG